MSDLQFDRIEPAQSPAQPSSAPSAASGPGCRRCGAALGEYFDVNGVAVCPGCKDKLVAEQSARRPGRFLKAGLYGTGAAIGCAILYYAVAKLTGYEIGLVAIVVGLAVGWAVHQGSGKRGGRTYQALAMALTYTSICLSHAPALFEAFGKNKKARTEQTQSANPAKDEAATPAPAPLAPATPAGEEAAAEGEDEDGSGDVEEGDAAAAAQHAAAPANAGAAPGTSSADGAKAAGSSGGATTPAPAEKPPKLGLGGLLIALAAILGLLLALPFLAVKDAPFGLVLIAIALYEAWKLNREVPLSIAGPLQSRAAPPPVAVPAAEGAGA